MTGDLVEATVTIPREQLERLEAELADLRQAAQSDPWRARWGAYRERVRAREREQEER